MAVVLLLLCAAGIFGEALAGRGRQSKFGRERLLETPVIDGPTNTTAYQGQNVSLECRVLTGSRPHVQWLRHYAVNGSYLSPEGEPYVTLLKTNNSEILELVNVSSEDSGWYTCLVANAFGRTYESAWLDVKDRDDCPEGWLKYMNKCYYLSKDRFSWIDSQMTCKVLNSKLAEIQTAKEDIFLKQFFGEMDVSSFWIGITDMEVTGTFKYVEDKMVIQYSDMATGPRPGSKANSCMEVTKARRHNWRPANCRKRKYFVCERSSVVDK